MLCYHNWCLGSGSCREVEWLCCKAAFACDRACSGICVERIHKVANSDGWTDYSCSAIIVKVSHLKRVSLIKRWNDGARRGFGLIHAAWRKTLIDLSLEATYLAFIHYLLVTYYTDATADVWKPILGIRYGYADTFFMMWPNRSIDARYVNMWFPAVNGRCFPTHWLWCYPSNCPEKEFLSKLKLCSYVIISFSRLLAENWWLFAIDSSN